MDKLLSMEVFVAVADKGSFTAASATLNMSSVMVGKHISQLEERLGARLIARTTRRQSLTEIGQRYCEHCRSILAEVKAAESGAEAMRATPRGVLKINAPVSFGAERLAPAMTDYLALHPEVSLDLQLNDRVVDLIEEGFDAAIRIGLLEDSGFVARPLMPYQMLICASPAYIERVGVPKTPADLSAHQCLNYTHWSKHVRWRLGDGHGGDLEFPASRFRSNNGQALRVAALRGFGVVLQSEALLGDDVANGRLVPLLNDYLPPPRPMHLIYPRDRRPTAKLTTFIDFITERFAP